MEFKDYYAILGVKADADNKDIKKAYQTLAKKYHPDVNPGDKAAEDRFKEINEAYHAVSDPAKRQKYDEVRRDYEMWRQRDDRSGFEWDPRQAASGSAHTRPMSAEEFADIFGDIGLGPEASGFSDFFSTIFGGFSGFASGGEQSGPFYDNVPVKGRDVTGEAEISLEEAYLGASRTLSLARHRIEAKIPPGVRDNTRLRLAGQGESGTSGGARGDLYLKVLIRPHRRYERRNDDLQVKIPLDFYQAALGATVPVQTLSGPVMLKIPPQTQSGRRFRLKGKGMPRLSQPGEFGDLYAEVEIVLPENMTAAEIAAIEDIARQRNKEGQT
ncbi:MAG: DnaJ domain-containing protein [Gracilibacteraceae bacterium]|jgi:curved DNA-binding protein|nr:DnaJ domain-containing protein [Gracilibacteraceae bacterium]